MGAARSRSRSIVLDLIDAARGRSNPDGEDGHSGQEAGKWYGRHMILVLQNRKWVDRQRAGTQCAVIRNTPCSRRRLGGAVSTTVETLREITTMVRCLPCTLL